MSESVVVDASVAIKWLLREEHTDQALALRQDVLRSGGVLAAPPLLSSEITNALFQAERRAVVGRAQLDRALDDYLGTPVQILEPIGLLADAIAVARRHNLKATYDAQYLVVAQTLQADFWTADLKLVRSLPRSMKWVRWIGNYVSQG
jgi:predicted nucleic acid-binding protein